jgi:hypothetical protein
MALAHALRIHMEWPVMIADLVSAEIGELDRPRRRWWPRASRVQIFRREL